MDDRGWFGEGGVGQFLTTIHSGKDSVSWLYFWLPLAADGPVTRVQIYTAVMNGSKVGEGVCFI